VKDSVRMWTASGTLVTIIAIAIGLLSIYFQTDPGENHTLVLDVLLVLQITGADLFAIAILEWKQEVSSITVLILMAIGLVGFSASASFHNALVDAFFPRTIISVILGIHFIEVGMLGVFLWILRGRIPVK
jgi:hypothetical protein